jgi:hypothetical protein
MAVQTAYQTQYLVLTRSVRRWETRRRLALMLLWLPRALAGGLAVGVAAAVASRLRPLFLPSELLTLSAAAVAAALVACVAAVWLWRAGGTQRAAQRFDALFNLGERVSTALELIEGRIQTVDELAGRQIADAAAAVSRVRAGSHLPLRAQQRDLLIAAVLAGVLALLIALPNPQTDAIARDSAAQAALEEAAETMRDLTQQIAADPNLSDPERQQVLEALQAAIDTLERGNISPEEAFASVAEVEAALRNRANDLSASAAEQRAALESASAALRQMQTQAQPGAGQGDSAGEGQQRLSETLSEMLGDMAEQMQQGSLSQGQQQQAAAAMQQAAQSLQPIDPQTAQSLQNAAQAMQNAAQMPPSQTDPSQAGQQDAAQGAQQDAQQAAQDALQQAQNAAQNAENTAQDAQNAAEQMQQRADQAAQASQQVGQQQQPGRQPGQQQGQQASQQQGQNAQQSQMSGAQNQGSQGQQGSDSPSGQSGQQPGSSESSPAESAQSSQGGGQPGQSSESDDLRSSSRSSGSSAQGAGDAESSAGNDSGAAAPQAGQIRAQNNPDGGGEGQFDPIYAPRRLGGALGDTDIQLESDPDSVPMTEGEFSQNPTGQSFVPYTEVYGDYRQAANRALDSDYIPLGLRDVVRDYFTSLEPGSAAGQRED